MIYSRGSFFSHLTINFSFWASTFMGKASSGAISRSCRTVWGRRWLSTSSTAGIRLRRLRSQLSSFRVSMERFSWTPRNLRLLSKRFIGSAVSSRTLSTATMGTRVVVPLSDHLLLITRILCRALSTEEAHYWDQVSTKHRWVREDQG